MGIIGAAVAIVGFEDVCKKEMISLGAKNGVISKGIVTFEAKDELTLAKIAYKAHTTSRIFMVLGKSKVLKTINETKSEFGKVLENIDLFSVIKKEKTFKVECERNGEHDFKSTEVEVAFGSAIIKSIEQKKDYAPKVAIENPDVIIYTYIRDDFCIFGVDFCGFDTSKRDYHIFINKIAIKGTVAACLSLFAEIKPKKTVLDTFSSSGTIVIETALMSNDISPHNFRKEEFVFRRLDFFAKSDLDNFFKNLDKKQKSKDIRIIATDPILANVRSTAKNAKIAGVQKDIEVSRVDTEWLDTKVDKSSVDVLITRLPSASRSSPEKDVEKLYKEFFYQLEYIMKKDSKAVILLADESLMLKRAKDYKFKEIDKREIMIGKLTAKVVTLRKEG